VSQFPVTGDQLDRPRNRSGGVVGIVVGIAGAIYGGLGVGQAIQHAMDTVWAVPRNVLPIGSVPASEVGCCYACSARRFWPLSRSPRWVGNQRRWGRRQKAGVVLAAMAINTGVILVGGRMATARELSHR
jgi:membrane protein